MDGSDSASGFPLGISRSFVHGNTDLSIPDTLVLRRAFDLPPVLQGGPHAICVIGKSRITISRCLMHSFTGLAKLRFPMAYLPRSFCRSDGCRRRSAAIIRAHPKFNHTLIFLPENSSSSFASSFAINDNISNNLPLCH
jgi:hypothetical protein